MIQNYKKILGVCLAAFVLTLAVWAVRTPFSSAAAVSSGVYVTVCGNGILEGVLVGGLETCDDGKHCADNTACIADVDCVGVGDEVCTPRDGDGCSSMCIIEGGGSRPRLEYLTISQIRAYPEQRSGSIGSNYDTQYYLYFYDPNNQNRTLRYQHSSLLVTNNSGVSDVFIVPPTSITAGNYDVIIKSKTHLSRVLDNAYLQLGENTLNFTNITNTTTIGSRVLVAGDISGTGISPDTYGDDVINSVDLSILMQQIGSSDSSGNNIRANLNQDTIVDQADLNILLGNLDMEGDL